MNELSWEIRVPILKNTVIIKQLGLAVGIPFGLVALLVGLVSGRSVYTLYALSLIAAVLVLAWLLIMAVYGGKYEAEFMLDNKGALCRTGAKQVKRNRIINTLTVVLGLFTGRPAVAGAGVLAHSRQEVHIQWSRVTKVKYKPKTFTIMLRGGLTEQIALFCLPENYYEAERFVKNKLAGREESE